MTTSIQQLSLPSINGSFIQPGANLLDGMSESRVVAQAAKPKSFAPNDTEAAAIRRFTPGYAGGGAVQLVPGSSPDGRNIGKYDANTGKSTVWEGAANQQAQRLGGQQRPVPSRHRHPRAVARGGAQKEPVGRRPHHGSLG
jgi:hypothetical protein